MIISKEKLDSMNTSSVFDLVSFDMDKYYRYFHILGFSKKEYSSKLSELIDKTRVSYDGKDNYIDYLTRLLFQLLKTVIEERNINPREYIINVFSKERERISEEKALQFLKAFHEIASMFFDEEELESIMDDLLEDINIFSKSLKKLVEKNSEVVCSESVLSDIKEDYLPYYLLYYCKYHNIISYDLKGEDLDIFKIYLKDISAFSSLEEDEISECIKEMRNGNLEAREKLINSFLRLPLFFARKYKESFENKYPNRRIPLLDLIQVGNEALTKAADMFDPSKGVKFITYASAAIKNNIKNELADNQCVVRRPRYIGGNIEKINEAINYLTKELGRYPTLEEISDRTELNVEFINSALGAYQEEKQYDDLQFLGNNLETFDYNASSPVEKIVCRRMYNNLLHKIMKSTLTERERKVLNLFYREGETLKEIGEIIGRTDLNGIKAKRSDVVTRQAVDSIRNRAIKKLQEHKKPLIVTDELDLPLDVKLRNARKILQQRQEEKMTNANKPDIKLEDLIDRISIIFKDPLIKEIIDEDLFEKERRVATILFNNFNREHPHRMKTIKESFSLKQKAILETILLCLSFYMERKYGIILENMDELSTGPKIKVKIFEILNGIEEQRQVAS